MSHQFTVSLNDADARPVVHITGRVERENAAALENVLRNLLRQGKHQIVLDCSKLTYLNSAGARGLLTCRQEAQDKGGDLKWVGLRADAVTMLLLLEECTHDQNFGSCEEALSAFEQPLINT